MQRTVDVPVTDVSPTGIQLCIDQSCTDLPTLSSDGTAKSSTDAVSFTSGGGGKVTLVARVFVVEATSDTAVTVRFRRASTGETIAVSGVVHWTDDGSGCHDRPVTTDI